MIPERERETLASSTVNIHNNEINAKLRKARPCQGAKYCWLIKVVAKTLSSSPFHHLRFFGGLLELMMEVCFVPSLQHLSCSKIVTSLLNKVFPLIDASSLNFSKKISLIPFVPRELLFVNKKNYKEITRRVVEDIRRLVPCASLQKKLENFISPLFCEIEEWEKICYRSSSIDDDTFIIIVNNIPQCWLTDGTIDREKLVQLVVKNNNILLTNRFIFACTYCLYEDVLNLWELLSETEKSLLRIDSDFVVKNWITWLESRSNKDWQFCVAWILGTSLWYKNVYVLKRVLGALTPSERSHYLLKALTQREVSSSVVRYCLSLMTRNEQELFFKESPVKVFECITSWPVRSCFFDIVDLLRPYLTADTFCNILNRLLLQMKNQKRDCVELLVILKNFWIKSPRHFQNIAKCDPRFSGQLQFILEHDFTQAFSKPEDTRQACFRAARADYVMQSRQQIFLDMSQGRQSNLHPLLIFPALI
ncbi:hypothetical protein AVEN_10450-1 [Araneus ventricosus]|uniref:Uncharacterized protein n=1 Tax=Araneus ventricosus TaxID=182803 RepID=A0A4Y2MGT3_ARAVE|nr:hypothetical protein AVEN_10450-1 [Araneus ventricosus]